MAKIVFYCNDTLSNIHNMEYYWLDIKALEDIGHSVVICTRYRDIPRSFDAIYIYWWTYALIPILLAKLKRKPAFVSGVFNYSFPEWQAGRDYSKRPVWQRWLMRVAMQLAEANLITSRSDFINCSKAFSLSNAHYTPCCIGDEYFEIKNKAETNQMMNIAWSADSNLKRKGVYDILNALVLVKSSGYKFHLKLVGAVGDGSKKLKKMIISNGLEEEVDYIGEVSKDEKLKLLQSSKIYIQPSNYEGFGLASAEAMAAGLKVIACDVGDVRNTLGDHAIYVENGNISDIADKIISVISNEIDSAEISTAKKFLASKYSYREKLSHIKSIVNPYI